MGLFETDAPGEEPQGYVSAPGFVKSNPANNQHYLDQFKADPWYPILVRTHDRLEELIPGYNISQIKEKFGGLRYYINYPDTVIVGEYNWNDTPEKIRKQVEDVIHYAEAWVDGFEHARKTVRKIQAFHRAKSGEDKHGPYVICDYDKTEWPCRTQRILEGIEE